MNISEYQTNIIRQVLLIDEKSKLDEIRKFVRKFKLPLSVIREINEADVKDVMEFETFEDWNAYLQSTNYKNPDEFLDEWNMTSIELCKFIWDAEHSGQMTYQEFIEDTKTW